MVRAPRTLDHDSWPPNYVEVWQWRQKKLRLYRRKPDILLGAKEYYKTHPVAFINHWVDTYDPRNAGSDVPARIPLVMFKRQEQMVYFLQGLLREDEDGLFEKCRDFGATWVCGAFSIWMWLFWDGASVGWGSRKQDLVDRIGDMDSIFEKLRSIVMHLPREFWPVGFNPKTHMTFMKLINPEHGATITGEVGDDIGRGGRKRIYFKDESAHYARPEKIEAALGDNTNVQVDISSVNGLGNVFHRKRESAHIYTGKGIKKGRVNAMLLDWREHPAKNQEWYDERKNKAQSMGLAHVFAQEVDRNYSSSVIGTVIPAEWIESAVDAHIKLGVEPTGPWIAGLDVADNERALDANAQVFRKGMLLASAEEWYERDVGATARRAIDNCDELEGPVTQFYDNIGVGAGVKSEANRLKDEGKLPSNVELEQWCASAKPQFPDEHYEPDDEESPLNKDFYQNLKAQGGWELRRRFERTHKAVTEGIEYDPDELISISSSLPLLQSLKKELAQPTAKKSVATGKLVINKTPDGTKSPNLYDATVQAFWPIEDKGEVTAMVFL